MKCIIIDDEPLALNIMNSYCEEIGNLDVIGTYTNPMDASELLMSTEVDLIFLDIEMPQISGLDFVKTLDRKPLFIVTTAYHQYALEGFELNAVDYLVKPIPFARFVKAVNRAREIYLLKKDSKKLPLYTASNTGLEKGDDQFVFIKSDYENIKLKYSDILYIQGLKEYLRIHVKIEVKKPILTLMSFKQLKEKLPANQFLRVHRSFVVNVASITSIQRNKIIIGNIRIPIGESYKETCLKRLGID
jgi:DNA-binding LytR/AlgR family response regulator